uniref:Uncharacterized protein n=2 Tax=Oryza TaxID=4527 RepID=Q69MD9_ORYSJ|nr:hypothetical protein [Oryza sativa Japonica Group]BAD38557.1 hypothetical protein [Oryza sativa Japonica Group]
MARSPRIHASAGADFFPIHLLSAAAKPTTRSVTSNAAAFTSEDVVVFCVPYPSLNGSSKYLTSSAAIGAA